MKNKLSNKALASLMVVGMTLPNTTIVNAVNENEQDSAIIENNDSLDNQINEETQETQSEKSADEVEENQNASNEESQTREVIGQTKFVDENGNIKTVDVYDGTTGEEYNPNARTVNTANMVNFNCSKAGVTTKYIDYYTGKEGYLSKTSAADAAFLGTENGKIKFMISGVTGLVDSQYVEVVSQGTYYASNYEVNSRGKLYHYISNNVNATGNEGNFNYVGAGPSYLTKGVEYYSYDGHYFYSDYNAMINDYKNNTRANSINPNNPYYSYFQYLPLRSKTSYTGAQLTSYLNNKANSSESKLNNTGDIFVKYQNQYGVNALMAASFAALESWWGKSDIAKSKNNLFGLNATDNNPGGNADSFNTVDDCIMNFTSSWMSKRYLNATYSSLFRGGYFGDKASGIFGKYSSDPYEGEKCASIAENMDAGISSKDKGNYTIGIKDISSITHTSLDVLKDSNINSTKLYSTISNSSCAFIIRKKDTENGYYQVQSDSVLNNDRTNVSTNAEYDYDESYGYVNKNDLTIINNGNDVRVNQTPVIESAEVTDITADGYTVTCKITDDGGVDRVLMPTWTDKNGQDDLRWYTANKNGNTYTLKVKTSNHNNEGGTYYTHIYAYDTEGKQAKRELTISVPEKGKPEIKNVEVSTPTRAGYTVTCTVESSTAITRVLMPTWTNKNGQDDLVWHNAKVESQGNGKYKVSYTVKTSDHNNEDGRYITHIYAYNSAGKEACYQITKDIEIPENQAPVIESAEVTDVNRKSFEIKAHVTDDSKVDRVLAAVWTDKNGQDDLRWYTLQNDGGLYYLDINMNEHNYETGSVNVHVYAYDDEGKQTKKELLAEIPQNQAPVITNVAISDITNDSYKITCNVSDDLQVTSVKMPTWTENGGQDDIVWHGAEVNNGVATFTVNRKDHNFEYGNYITHIYAYDAEGLTGSEIGGTVTLKEPEDGKPVIKNVYITDANDDGFMITCEVTAKDGIRDVLIPTWTYKSGQDDIIWHKANNIGGNKYSCRILRKDHKSEFGAYVSHIYAYTTTNVENHIELNYHNIVNTTVAQGWTYINGEKYFFDNKGNMVGNMPCKKVVDISSYNGDIDWETAVKYGDIDGVIIRIVNHPNGSYQEDPKFARNLEACRRYNIPFGVYIYDYSHSTGDAYNEAELVMSILRKYNVSASELKYNIYFDMERNQNSTGLNSQQMSDIAATFINRISNYGYRAYIYSYRSLLNEYLNTPYIWSQTNWLAAYTNTMGWSNPYYHGSFGWQYTSDGVIPGFNGNNGYVDVSCWFEI